MGRKKMKVGEKTDVRLRVDADLSRRIQEAAEREGNSVAAFIRAAVVEKLDRLPAESGKRKGGKG